MADPDFSDLGVLHDWFVRNCTGDPQDWPPERRDEVWAESIKARNALDDHMRNLSENRADKTIFWTGVTAGSVSAVLLLFPPVGIPATIATWATLIGLGASVAPLARRKYKMEMRAWLTARSRDLNRLQFRLRGR